MLQASLWDFLDLHQLYCWHKSRKLHVGLPSQGRGFRCGVHCHCPFYPLRGLILPLFCPPVHRNTPSLPPKHPLANLSLSQVYLCKHTCAGQLWEPRVIILSTIFHTCPTFYLDQPHLVPRISVCVLHFPWVSHTSPACPTCASGGRDFFNI